jgi:protein gp37
MKADWVRQIRAQCVTAKVPFFFKQWVASSKVKLAGRLMEEHGTRCPNQRLTEQFLH